jgi:hypothetical protein
VTQTLEKKNQVFTPVNNSPDRIKKKKEEEIICPQHRKEKNSENN